MYTLDMVSLFGPRTIVPYLTAVYSQVLLLSVMMQKSSDFAPQSEMFVFGFISVEGSLISSKDVTRISSMPVSLSCSIGILIVV